jgi:hypothetical protein
MAKMLIITDYQGSSDRTHRMISSNLKLTNAEKSVGKRNAHAF